MLSKRGIIKDCPLIGVFILPIITQKKKLVEN